MIMADSDIDAAHITLADQLAPTEFNDIADLARLWKHDKGLEVAQPVVYDLGSMNQNTRVTWNNIRRTWSKLQSLHELSAEYQTWWDKHKDLDAAAARSMADAQSQIEAVEFDIEQIDVKLDANLYALKQAKADQRTLPSVKHEFARLVTNFDGLRDRLLEVIDLARESIQLNVMDLDAAYLSDEFRTRIQRQLAQLQVYKKAAANMWKQYSEFDAKYQFEKSAMLPKQHAAVPLQHIGVDDIPKVSTGTMNDKFLLLRDDPLQQQRLQARHLYDKAWKQYLELRSTIKQSVLDARAAALQSMASKVTVSLKALGEELQLAKQTRAELLFQTVRDYLTCIDKIKQTAIQMHRNTGKALLAQLQEYEILDELLERKEEIKRSIDVWPVTLTDDFGAKITAKLDALAQKAGQESYHMSLQDPSQKLESGCALKNDPSDPQRTVGGLLKRAFQRIMKPLTNLELTQYKGFLRVGSVIHSHTHTHTHT